MLIKEWETSSYLKAEIHKNENMGILCGYVIIPKDHKAYPKIEQSSYHDIDVCVHGGITYGEILEDGSFMLGFDCGHAGDVTGYFQSDGDTYKDEKYVWLECEMLAYQLDTLEFEVIKNY